ncbi:MAG: hypothetical protein V4710_01355 [Verrucomicrobiota bacterium]
MIYKNVKRMKTYGKTTWFISLAALLVVAALGVAAGFQFLAFFSPGCGNDVLSEIVSPDGAHKAVIFRRDCGATTDYSTQISILPAHKPLPNQSGDVFISDFVTVQVTWSSVKSLVISYPADARVYRAAKIFHDVAITYTTIPSA